MALYKIGYSGWTTTLVEANSPEEAEAKFWDDGLNELNDATVDVIDKHEHIFMYGHCTDWTCRTAETMPTVNTEGTK